MSSMDLWLGWVTSVSVVDSGESPGMPSPQMGRGQLVSVKSYSQGVVEATGQVWLV